MEENNKISAPKEKKKPKCDKRRSSRQDDNAVSSEPPSMEGAPATVEAPPDDVTKEEIKKFKESLLQSVSSGEQAIFESADFGLGEELQRDRERSISRQASAPVAARGDILAELDEEKLFELKEAFLLFDLNGDGYIDHQDLCGTLISLGEKIDEQYVRNMLSEAASPLDFDAFVSLLGYKTIDLDTEETLVGALSRWDRDNSGLIPEERIRHDLMSWGDKFTEKEADYALDDAPIIQKGGRPMIDYVRFCSQLCGLKKRQKKECID